MQAMTVVSSPPFLPDFAPCDFILFLRMKEQLRGCHFCGIPEIWEGSLI
jgi:hypothetical protein